MDPRLTTGYSLSKPIATHRRPATCDEVNCKYLRNGWQLRVWPNNPLGERQIFLVKQSKRRFTRVVEPMGSVLYQFEAGQQCFGNHTAPVDRPAIYTARQGTQVKRHTTPEYWIEDFAIHLDKIRE